MLATKALACHSTATSSSLYCNHKKNPTSFDAGFFNLKPNREKSKAYWPYLAFAARRSFSSAITFSETDAGQGK
jgi:hypothetical protein